MDGESKQLIARRVALEQRQASNMALGVMIFAIVEAVVLSILFTTLLNHVGVLELGSYVSSESDSTLVVVGFLSVPSALALFLGIEFSFVACRMASRHHNNALFVRLGIATFIFLIAVTAVLPAGMTIISDTLTGAVGNSQPVPVVELLRISRGV